MASLGKVLHVATAGAGFFAGYLWAVSRWAGAGDRAAAHLVRAAMPAGAALSLLYVALLGGLFWAWIPSPRAVGLRAVVSPAAFTLSFLAGALGIQGALRLLGG